MLSGCAKYQWVNCFRREHRTTDDYNKLLQQAIATA